MAREPRRHVIQNLACLAAAVAVAAALWVQATDYSDARERVLPLVSSSSPEQLHEETVEGLPSLEGQSPHYLTGETPEERRDRTTNWRADAARALFTFRVKQQLIDWEQEWSLARKLQAKLAEQHLDLAQEIAANRAELESIIARKNEQRQDLVVWRLVEADPVNQSIKLTLAKQQAKRDSLAKEFVEGSVWLRREDDLIALTRVRLSETIEKLEKARVTTVDPVGEWLRARRCQLEVTLDRLLGRAALVATHLQSVKERLAAYRSVEEQLLRFQELFSIQEPNRDGEPRLTLEPGALEHLFRIVGIE